MPISSKQDYLVVLQELVAFAEGDTSRIPVPVFKVGDGLLVSNHHTNKEIYLATDQQRELLQKELQHYLRGIANGHARMIDPYKIRTEIVNRVVDRRTLSRSYLIEGSSRDWLFYLVDRVLPHVSPEVLRSCPSCERVFVRVSQKRFCSPRCQKRMFMRHWRKEKEVVQ